MTEKRVQFKNIIQNQLPQYVKEEFPLIGEFLKQYYISQEFQGASADLIQNIDQYIKLDTIKSNTDYTTLTSDISIFDITISAENTIGFPNSYGLIQIDDEIITYTGKTEDSFIGCIRGFSGVSSYNTDNKVDELVFTDSNLASHSKETDAGEPTKIINLSSLFLVEFFNKIKYQLSPGFENREFYENLDKYLFIKQSKDFYSTRGTDLSFKILFKALYGEDVKVIRPQDYLIKPSTSQYNVTNDLVVETITGNPYELENSTLFQDEYENISKGYVSISNVEKILTQDDKSYYKLSFDGGYNKDINVDGALYGNFSVHPNTKLIGEVSSGSNTLDVDSTVGFPSSGELSIKYLDGTEGIITYTSKSLNQFFGCENIQKTILDKTDIWLNTYAYGSSNKNINEIIKVRITSVLKSVDIIDSTYYQERKNIGVIRTLGDNSKDFIHNDWFVNISTSNKVLALTLIDNVSKIYQILTEFDHNLRLGDRIKIISSDGTERNSKIIDVISDKIVQVSDQGDLDLNIKYSIQRVLSKVNSTKYSYLSDQISNVQNVYKDSNKVLISSPSLPYYYDQSLNAFDRSITFSNTFYEGSDTFNIPNHGFYTGDSVYYNSGSGSLFDDGIYFVKRIDPDNLKFSKSRSNLYNSIFISLPSDVTVVDSKIEDVDFYNRKITSQKILREISPPVDDGNEYETNNGTIGIFINGVEILNYKSKDKIYYGPIQEIKVFNPGSNYDVINPPVLSISDSVGVGATGYCSVKGSLRSIRVLDGGFDYTETPKINITGGNGFGAKANPLMKLVDNKVYFNSQSQSNLVNLSSDTIGFTTYHKLKQSERIIYDSEGQTPIGGLSENSSYYVSIQSPYEIKLHKTFEDSFSGINTISLTSYGIGNHFIRSYNKKQVLSSISVEDSGFNYENKKRTAKPELVDIYLDKINIEKHDFKSGEIITYSTTGSSIGGLSNYSDYYVTKIDEDSFKLSLVGIGTDNKDLYYITNQYIDFTSIGSGIHIFNYPEIRVEVIGNVGISSINGNSFTAKVEPIFRGQITSVHLENTGVGYGSSEVLNFKRNPSINLKNGSDAKLVPIINDSKIVQVLINNPGKDYNSIPDLNIFTNGNGSGAVLDPILENGQIKSIKVIENGYGYDKNNTFINVSSAGNGAVFDVKLKTWTVNLFTKYFNKISSDDGFIFYNKRSNYELEYAHLYAPRKLRQSVYSKDSNGRKIYGAKDLTIDNVETSSSGHSPIIGWAYDGNPIYGPYGYSDKDSGSITQMKSGYVLTNIIENRPPFPSGFFVEDYEYRNNGDNNVLDQYNGRFCITPEFPNGTYAYFATFEENSIENNSSNPFNGYKIPAFPYVIGNKFKSTPNQFNFSKFSNQDDIDLNETDWVRITTQYNLDKEEDLYNYLTKPSKLDQLVSIKYASPGSVEKIDIISGGEDYKVDDLIIFDETGTGGFGIYAKVSELEGKTINSISGVTTSVYNFDLYSSEGNSNTFTIQSESPHGFLNGDIVTINSFGFGNIFSPIKTPSTIGVSTNTLAISNNLGISSVSTTGIATYFSVFGNLLTSGIRENDIFSIKNEKVKILNVDANSSRIRVLRCIDGTVGSAHSFSDILYEIPRRFTVNGAYSSFSNKKLNKEIYFDPKESLGIGTVSGAGIGVTIFFSNPGLGVTSIFIPTKSIYIPNHNLDTGDELIYSTNSGTEISVSINGTSSLTLSDQSKVYVAKISNDFIGISTVKVGLGSTGIFVGIGSTNISARTLYFTGIGTGTYHSFKTNYEKVSGQALKNVVTVSTAQTHGLRNNDYVSVNVKSGISTIFVVRYNDSNRRLVINPRSFSSVGVNTITNSITIPNHNFINGQKLIYTSTSPSGGLVNNQIYYAVVFDENTIKLSSSFYDSVSTIPQIISITSSSNGTLSPVNPPIKIYKNSLLTFDLSDSSLSYTVDSVKYSAFDLNLYLDSNMSKLFETTSSNTTFEVQKSGKVGIDSSAKLTLRINDDVPEDLFYNLDVLYSELIPNEKEEIKIDDSVFSNNQIQIVNSEYSGKHRIVSTSSSSFTYNIQNIPEISLYNSTNSILSYKTDSLNSSGPISNINLLSKGQNYYTLPDFSTIISTNGKNAILEASSLSIGKIQKTKINNIGYAFPSDFTLKPNLSLPQILRIEPLNSFDSIGITSVGRGYVTVPKLVVIDTKTKEILPEVDLTYSFGDTNVTILNNTYRLNDVDPTIIPTQNSNGVGISSINYNSLTNDVTVTLSVGFSTASSFPFSVGDKVLVENVSVGINSTGKGYNSKDYNYELFTITSVDENIGGEGGSIIYNLYEFLSAGEVPGVFDAENSSGRVIPEKYFPKFKSTLKPNNFLKNEEIRYSGEIKSIGFVQNWNEKIKQLTISSKEYLEEGKILEGVSSRTQGSISSAISPNSFINLGSYSKSENGWIDETGILNNNLQRIQDNFYYQNFSYSLKSRVSYDTWDDVVGSLNHAAGFKKFSDYQLESIGNCGIQTYTGSNIEVSVDINGFASLNCVYDFDLARENALFVDSQFISDEITFSSRILTDYLESVSNRVLSIDDISDLFNSNERLTRYLIVHRFKLTDARAQKYITLTEDRRYSSQRQLMILTLLHDNSEGYINQYGRVETTYDLGSFDFSIEGTDGLILFYPTKYRVNDYNVTVLSYNIKDNFAGIGSTSIGGIVDIKTNTIPTLTSPTTIVGIGSTYTSSKILVSVATTNNGYQFDELNVVHDGTNVEFISYGQLTNTLYSSSGLGTYNAYISGSNLNVDFIPNVGVAASVSTIQVSIANTSSSGIGTFAMNYMKFEANSVSIASSTNPTQNVIAEYSNDYEGGYFIVQVSDVTNNRHQLSEVAVVNDNNYAYLTEYANIETYSGLGTMGAEKTLNKTQITFTPLANIDVVVKVCFNSLSNIIVS